MKIFALDSSDNLAFSVSIIKKYEVLFEKTVDCKITSGFFSEIGAVFSHVRSADYFVVNTGPGSYTGLRAGLSVLNGIAIAENKQIIGLDAFQVFADKFLSSNDCASQNIDIFLKSYSAESVYHQRLDMQLVPLTKHQKISVEDAKKINCNCAIGNAKGLCKELKISATDIASLAMKKILSNNYNLALDLLYMS